MALELHNFVWEGERLVQVETQPHHITGILAEIRKTLENSDTVTIKPQGY
jgi:DNA-binding winged helix-turn-helix (wHTH) protein